MFGGSSRTKTSSQNPLDKQHMVTMGIGPSYTHKETGTTKEKFSWGKNLFNHQNPLRWPYIFFSWGFDRGTYGFPWYLCFDSPKHWSISSPEAASCFATEDNQNSIYLAAVALMIFWLTSVYPATSGFKIAAVNNRLEALS